MGFTNSADGTIETSDGKQRRAWGQLPEAPAADMNLSFLKIRTEMRTPATNPPTITTYSMVSFEFTPASAQSTNYIDLLAKRTSGSSITSSEVTEALIPVDLGVDNNRDGTLALGSAEDQTTEQKPYRFWLNNDDDNGWDIPGDTYNAKQDNPWTPGVVDNLDEEIKEVRDLEDFARLHLKVENLHSQLAAGTMTLGLKWKTVQSGIPKIRLFKAVEADGGTKYLSDTAKAADQVSASTSAIGVVQGTTVLDLPVSFWIATASNATKFFLFEATGEGIGELTMVFKQGSTVIGEGESVFLNLLDIRKMYEQRGINPAAVIPNPDVDVLGTISGVTAVSYQAAPHIFQPAWDENLQDKNYVICVHGWRKGGPAYPATDPKFYKGRSDEITMFKRLWHRGFKGRYIGFIWPTYDVEVGDQSSPNDLAQTLLQSKFAWSEYRAWKCGEAFKNMVNGLPSGYKKKVMAHSLGNVVVGSALEQGASIDHYALLNAAIPAYCYDVAAALPLGPLATTAGHADFSFDLDAGIKALSYRGNTAVHGKARLEGVAGSLFNFYLPSDLALIGWQANQIGVAGGKPISDLITGGYQYDLTGREIQWDPIGTVNRKVTDPHEAMAMVNNSWSNALGREASTGGKIDPSKNLDMGPVSSGMGFGSEHEAVFKWQCAKTWKFYELLWNALDLTKPIAP